MIRLLLIRGTSEAATRFAASVDQQGAEIVVVDGAREAIPAVQSQRFDAAILCWTPNDGDLMPMLSPLRAAEIDLPIVILSDSLDDSWIVPAIHAGAQDYVRLGIVTREQLWHSLQKAIARARVAGRTYLMLGDESARAGSDTRGTQLLTLASQILVSSMEPETTLQALAHLVTEHLASHCFIECIGASPLLVATGRDDESVGQTWPRVWSLSALPHPRTRAMQGEASLVHHGAAALLSTGVGEAERTFMRAIAPESCIVVPLFARGEVRGSITLVRPRHTQPFSQADLELVEDLAGRVALAVDNARLYHEAQSAARARDEVIAVVSHDLRNPLTIVQMAAYNLRNALREQLPSMSPHLDKIDRATNRMNRLIEDLLDITCLDAGAIALDRQPHAVRSLLREIHELHLPLADEKAVRLEWTEVPESLVVDVDRHRTLQILSNLMGNAIKFTPREGRVRVQVREDVDQVTFGVQDTGPGIAADNIAHLFDRFWQAERGDRRGTGLGLAIARGLVEAHGGRIWVESELNVGSTFFFSLPRAVPMPTIRAGQADATLELPQRSTASPESAARRDRSACG